MTWNTSLPIAAFPPTASLQSNGFQHYLVPNKESLQEFPSKQLSAVYIIVQEAKPTIGQPQNLSENNKTFFTCRK